MNAAEILDVRLVGAGWDDARLVRVSVTEAIDAPTAAEVVAITEQEVDLEASLRGEVALEVLRDGAVVRTFRLVVVGATFDGTYAARAGGDRALRWRIALRHPLALLALRSDVRMFQEQDASAIVQQVLQGGGLAPDTIELALRRSLMKRAYCVQYRETDLAFVSRLLEHEGIFYVCDHGPDRSRLLLADSPSAFRPIDGGEALLLLDDRMHGSGVHDFWLESVAVPDQVSTLDYDPYQPNLSLLAEEKVEGGATTDALDYPAGHRSPEEGAILATLRAEHHRTFRRRGSGRTDRLELAPGRTFLVDGLDAPEASRRFVVTRVEHTFALRAADADGSNEATFSAAFECVAADAPYRPARKTPRPVARGLTPVLVTGPSGEEIHTDELGCLKAHFHWDRVGAQDDLSSCWIRLVQLPISGSMTLARVGWEMAVVHLEGDPDRPTAIARAYNAERVSPYGYPAAASKMALQTASSPGGGKTNEVRLSDGDGGQEFFVNAAKDAFETTVNVKTEDIGGDESITIGLSSQLDVGAEQESTIGGNLTTTIASDDGLRVATDRSKDVGGSETVMVMDNVTAVVTGADDETVGGTHTTLAAMGIDRTTIGSQTLTVAGSMVQAAAMEVSQAVAGARGECVGAAKIVAAGSSIEQSAIGALAITVGGVCVQASGGNFSSGAKGPVAITVGGVALANAAGELSFKAPKISITVGGVANLLGGGGILNLTAGSASFAGLVKLEASGAVKITGNPNLVG